MQPGAALVVDDDATLARSLARSLTGLGWEVELAYDGREALQTLQRRSFDALVLDLQMPEADGFAVIEQLPLGSSRPVTILMSGHLDIPTTVRAVRMGAYDVVEKPALPTDIDERLRNALGQRRRVAEGSADAASRLVGETEVMQTLREQVRNVARFRDLAVLLIGEAGTGKELAAQAIHALSGSTEGLVSVSCAAIPEHLFETELFGSDEGFGASRGEQVGLLEMAGGGTVFFDEIAELPVQLQRRLLRTLETRSFRRVGGTQDIPFNARVISATDPRASTGENTVRPELYFRLSGFTIMTPTLRERASDIDILAQHFLDEFAQRYPAAPSHLSAPALEALHAYEWPGNVRELRAVVQRAAVLAQAQTVGADEIAAVLRERRAESELRASPASTSGLRLDSLSVNEPLRVLERRVIEEAWSASGNNLSAAARKLGLPRTTLRDRLRKYGLR